MSTLNRYDPIEEEWKTLVVGKKGDKGDQGLQGIQGPAGDTHVPDPALEADGRFLVTDTGALTYADAPEGGGIPVEDAFLNAASFRTVFHDNFDRADGPPGTSPSGHLWTPDSNDPDLLPDATVRDEFSIRDKRLQAFGVSRNWIDLGPDVRPVYEPENNNRPHWVVLDVYAITEFIVYWPYYDASNHVRYHLGGTGLRRALAYHVQDGVVTIYQNLGNYGGPSDARVWALRVYLYNGRVHSRQYFKAFNETRSGYGTHGAVFGISDDQHVENLTTKWRDGMQTLGIQGGGSTSALNIVVRKSWDGPHAPHAT